ELREQFMQWLGQRKGRLAIKQVSSSSRVRQDPYRILLYDRHMAVTGAQLQNMLEQQGIWIEMATASYAVLVWHMAMSNEQLQLLQHAVDKVEELLNGMLLEDNSIISN